MSYDDERGRAVVLPEPGRPSQEMTAHEHETMIHPGNAARDRDGGPSRSTDDGGHRLPTRPMRWAAVVVGLLCVGVGGLGIVLPGLPSTIFFILAAACFAQSSPRLERWVLNLPGIGQTVRDHRAGLGMPRRAKVLTILVIVAAGTLSAVLGLQSAVGRTVLAGACAVGIAVILWRVPTRETVIRQRQLGSGPAG